MSGRPILRRDGLLGNAGEAPGVPHRRRDGERLGAERLDRHVVPDDAGHLVGVVDDERGVAVAKLLDQERRRDALGLLDEPADLDLAVERVLDRLPRHELGAEQEPVVGEELVRLVGRADGPSPGSSPCAAGLPRSCSLFQSSLVNEKMPRCS